MIAVCGDDLSVGNQHLEVYAALNVIGGLVSNCQSGDDSREGYQTLQMVYRYWRRKLVE